VTWCRRSAAAGGAGRRIAGRVGAPSSSIAYSLEKGAAARGRVGGSGAALLMPPIEIAQNLVTRCILRVTTDELRVDLAQLGRSPMTGRTTLR
jgi:hypothetical protein